MRQTVRLGRVAGIPVGVHWSVFVIALLLAQGLAATILPSTAPRHSVVAYWGVAALVAVVFLAALLAHELAHALVAVHYGVRVRAITLWLLGGVSELDGQAPHARADLLIAGAGPLASLGCAGLFAGAAVLASALGAGSLPVAALAWLAGVNLLLAVFNLLPGAPLDGGRILAALLWWVRGDRVAAHRAASRAGVLLGTLLMAAGFLEILLAGNLGGLWLVVLGWFLTSAARAEATDTVLRNTLAGVRVADVMAVPAVCGYGHQSVAGFLATVARHHPHRAFPVLDMEGHLTGLVSLAGLARIPAPSRDMARLREVQVPADRIRVLAPATPLVDAAPALLAGGYRLAPVVVDGLVVGVLTASDLTRAVQLASLNVVPARQDEHTHPRMS